MVKQHCMSFWDSIILFVLSFFVLLILYFFLPFLYFIYFIYSPLYMSEIPLRYISSGYVEVYQAISHGLLLDSLRVCERKSV